MFWDPVFLLTAGVMSTIGGVLLKQSRLVDSTIDWYMKFVSLYFIGSLIFYGISFSCFAKALDRVPISVGYPVVATFSFVMLAVASNMLFGERFTMGQIGGLILIVSGMFLVAHGA